MNKIIFPHPPPHGGPGTFQMYLEAHLKEKLGYEVKYAGEPGDSDATTVFVNLGTRKLFWLIKNKIKGKTIIQRLDGINWRHKYEKKMFSTYFFKSVLTNLLVAFIRRFLADVVIYQSRFIKNDWDEKYGRIEAEEKIIYNATDLEKYRPKETEVERRQDDQNERELRIIGVEGNIQFDRFTATTLSYLDRYCKSNLDKYVIDLYGGYDTELKEYIEKENLNISLKGKVPREYISEVMREYDIYFTLELFPPCPNSVIEALASGLAITGYNTGSLEELVGQDCGVLLDPVNNEDLPNSEPDFEEFEKKVRILVSDYKRMGANARQRAINHFGKEVMLNKYLDIIY